MYFGNFSLGMLFAFTARDTTEIPSITERIDMQINQIHTRRSLVKMGLITLAMIPVVAMATKNDSMRTSTKFKETPEGDKQCSGCAQFVPGKSDKDLGGCKIFPGDTEVPSTGYCIAWSKKA